MDRVTVTLTLNLPQELAEEAESAGLLKDERVERWLVDELDRQRNLDRFFARLDQLRGKQAPITPKEIEEEIRLYRSEKRSHPEEDPA